MKVKLLRSGMTAVTVVALTIMQIANAQNTAPFWSLAGNSNATTSSKLGTTNAVPLKLFTNNILRVYVSSTGNVGIGTASPTNRLHVRQNIANKAIQWQHETTTDSWTIGIGTNTHNCRFEYNGALRGQISSVDGSFIVGSDLRLKEDIQPVASLLDKVKLLKPATYYYKDSRSFAKHRSIGFVAQEVETVFPELVYADDGGYKMLNYTAFAVVAIKAVQEQQQQIDALKIHVAEVDELKKEIAELRRMVLQLKGNTNGAVNVSAAFLEQNIPNPASGVSTIRYRVPEAAKSAKLTITNAKGHLVKTITLSSSDNGQVILNSASLPVGTYHYSLWVDGIQEDTRRLVIAR